MTQFPKENVAIHRFNYLLAQNIFITAIERCTVQWSTDLVEELVTAKFSTKSNSCRAKEPQIGRRNFLNCLLNRNLLLNRCTTVYV